MNKYPTISIVIPAYNEEKFIDKCLNSIFNQKYKGKLEVILVDDDSSDNTVKIAKKYPVTILNNGYKSAEIGKMIGLKQASGRYFLFLDADIDLPGSNWFDKMIAPLEENNEIVGSFTGYISYKSDPPMSKYITLDFLQRDPLFTYLTPKLNDVIVYQKDKYFVCNYEKDKILPAGLCVYRRKEILKTAISNGKKYMELDNLVILVQSGFSKFAYVPNAGLHHPYLTGICKLIKSRYYNLQTMYFGQQVKRYWTWIDYSDKKSRIKIIIWIIYAETLIPSLITGLYKCLKYHTWVGIYEPLVNFLSTNVIIYSFLSNTEGRKLWEKKL